MPLDASLDTSGWSPEALAVLLDVTTRLPLGEASLLVGRFGLSISASELERLGKPYAETCREVVSESLLSASRAAQAEALEALPTRAGRVMVLQADGVYTLGRPENGSCPGIEIKSAVLYPQSSPEERWMIADVTPASEFLVQLHGLTRAAGVSPVDELVGLSDGAAWVEASFEHLGATHITDVYHATEYLEVLMCALGWDEPRRSLEGRAWYCGEVNARDWLEKHQPPPSITSTWSQEALTALKYITTRLDSMDYKLFSHRGYPIGSGQVEGMNKHVIGTRMKRGGMHWSRQGAARMAALRAQHCAKHPLTTYRQLRHQAYPPPSP